MFICKTILPAILLFTFYHAVSQKADNLRTKGAKEEPEMIFVKGGSFMMGSNKGENDEKPVHSVTLGDFYIGKYEVTQKQWTGVMGNNPSTFSGCDNCPVEVVSWNDIQEFIGKLNRKTGKNYRLPSEAEWEYAARGGNRSRGYQYSGGNNPDDFIWYSSNSDIRSHPVGQKKPNELGIYDMSGNVWEWCGDWYDKRFYFSRKIVNPKGPSRGFYHVIRGGSWNCNTQFCRVSDRSNHYPDARDYDVGFRLVLTP